MEEWEEVNVESTSYTERLSVPGGWLYRSVVWDERENELREDGQTYRAVESGVAMVFVPIP